MKKALRHINLFICLLLCTMAKGVACPNPGTYTIGPGGNYVSLTQALTDLNGCSLTGAYIFELQGNYSATAEIFPINVPSFSGSSNINNITIRPQSGTNNLFITSNNPAGTILLNGATFLTIDGRPGGIGTTKSLTISNTFIGNAPAITFTNDASFNCIRYCNIRSANNGASSGTVLFGLAASGNGNDNNTIEFNEIWDAIEGTPTNAIYQSGSAFPKDNSNNNISNNNIYNYFNTSLNSAGILLQNNASNWTINNNSFYQTASRTMNGNTFAAIQSKDASVNSISIKNNFIGGTQNQCGGTALTITGKGNMNLLNLIFGPTSSTSIEGNIFRNISLTTTANKINSCINASGGKIAIGNSNNPNQIGNVAANGNIKIFLNDTISISTVDNAIFSAIKTDAINADTININSNQIGGIDVAGSSVTAFSATIYCTGNAGKIITINNSINNITSTLNNFLIGIWYNITNNPVVQNIENNTISNFINNNTNNKNIFYGILAQGNSIFNCLKNSIYNITIKSNLSTNYSITGIYFSNSSLNGHNIEANRIFNLVNTNTTINTSITGICFLVGTSSSSNLISKNFIHSLELLSPINNSIINGIHISSGNANLQNNMVRLGINSSGIAITKGHLIRAALESAGTINNFEHNSFYIGGSGILASSSGTACIFSLATSGSRKITNNILMNVRSNATTGSNRHYGIYLTSTSGLSCNYNNIYTSGTDTRFGYYLGERATLNVWQTGTSLDINSKNADPKFIAPNADATGVDLHINPNMITPIESTGLFSAGITTDFDNEARSTLSPTDIGADAGNYTAIGTDVGIAGLVTPQSNFCYGTSTPLSVLFKNYYTDTINFSISPVLITLQITGPVNQTFNHAITSGKLAPGATMNVIIPGTLDMSMSGTYSFNAYTGVTGTSKDFNNGNDAMQTIQIAVNNYNSWKGINANWNDPLNWCNNLIPDSTISVVIPAMSVGNFYPEIASGIRASTKNITLSANTNLNILSGGSINITGELFNNGSIINKGEIILSGNTNTNFPGNGILSYNNVLTIRKNNAASVVINRKIDIAGTLNPISGTIQLNDTILLISNKDTTANVAAVGAAFVYNSNGKFLVQRYIPAKRAWRLITAPLFATENIYNSWQNKGRYDANNYNKGTLITGTSANPVINGLDISTQNQASMKYWDTALQRISNINNTLTTSLSSNTNPIGANNTGYFMFIRGDRNPANTSLTNFNNTTLESTGYLQTGAQTFKLSASSGDPTIKRFTLIGNPYAATIDFGLLEKTNIPDQFYAWDPQALDVGRYVTVINTGSGYISIPDRGPDGPNRYIQSGQAFFVETGLNTSIISVLTIRENHKVATNNAGIFRPSNTLSAMRINLYRVSTDSTLTMADGTMAIFTDSLLALSNNTNPVKFTNINEMIGLKKNNQLLAVENKTRQQTDTLFVNISKTTSRNYVLEIVPHSIPQDNSLAFLEDTYLQTKTPISLNSNNQIKFSVGINNPSSLPDRFRIIFKPIVAFNEFSVSANFQDATLHWNTGDQTNVLHYEIQRSDDGVNFTTINSFDINNDGVYQMIDPQLTPGNYYYRIVAKANDNREATSSIKQIQINKPIIQSRIYPNPAPKQQPIQIQFNPIVPGKYLIQMTNLVGQTIFENNFIETRTTLKKININNQFPSGIYQLTIWKDGQKFSSQKLISE